MALAFRPAVGDDMRLVVDTWVSSYRLSHSAGLIAMDDWSDVMRPQVGKVLARPGVVVTVAYRPGETDGATDLHGWIAVEHDYDRIIRVREGNEWKARVSPGVVPLVHYVYVKWDYRKQGLARALFHAAGVVPNQPFIFTCRTAVVSKLQKKIPLARMDPLIARHPKKERPDVER